MCVNYREQVSHKTGRGVKFCLKNHVLIIQKFTPEKTNVFLGFHNVDTISF